MLIFYIAGHTPVRMVATIPGHKTPTGHVLTAVNIQGSPQKHTISTQRAIAPHGISVQQSPQGTPMVIQVSTPGSLAKPLVAATAGVRNATSATLIAQPASNDSLKTPLSAAPKVGQPININQGKDTNIFLW